MTKVPSAESLEINKLSLVMKDETIMGNVGTLVNVKLTAKKKSFHANIMARSAEAVIPDDDSGNATFNRDCHGEQPSMREASMMPCGISRKYDRPIQIIKGKFIEVYTRTNPVMVSSK